MLGVCKGPLIQKGSQLIYLQTCASDCQGIYQTYIAERQTILSEQYPEVLIPVSIKAVAPNFKRKITFFLVLAKTGAFAVQIKNNIEIIM